MKGTVARPQWPALDKEKADPKASSTKSPDTMSRIKLALLDAYSEAAGSSGYDPYNADPVRRGDVWSRKPKRD
jgi:hypothetical protein